MNEYFVWNMFETTTTTTTTLYKFREINENDNNDKCMNSKNNKHISKQRISQTPARTNSFAHPPTASLTLSLSRIDRFSLYYTNEGWGNLYDMLWSLHN